MCEKFCFYCKFFICRIPRKRGDKHENWQKNSVAFHVLSRFTTNFSASVCMKSFLIFFITKKSWELPPCREKFAGTPHNNLSDAILQPSFQHKIDFSRWMLFFKRVFVWLFDHFQLFLFRAISCLSIFSNFIFTTAICWHFLAFIFQQFCCFEGSYSTLCSHFSAICFNYLLKVRFEYSSS